MADLNQSAFEHDIKLPVRLDPDDDHDRPYRRPSAEDADRAWAKALQAVLNEPMPKPPERVTRDLYRSVVWETWQQRGQECTGFALAAIATFHLRMEQAYRALVDTIIEPSGSNDTKVWRRRLLTRRAGEEAPSEDGKAPGELSKKFMRLKIDGRDQWWQLRVAAAELLLGTELGARLLGSGGESLGLPGKDWAQRARKSIKERQAELREDPGATTVSRRMLYEMAQLYDGEDFPEGATLRGALRGWNRLGVASDDAWKYAAGDEEGHIEGKLGLARMLDAARRPGGYYLRIDPRDLPAMKKALARGGGSYPLLCSARLHDGWFRLFLHGASRRPLIGQARGDEPEGYHAFVIVGYEDELTFRSDRHVDRHEGFWVHNSWGEHWGDGGYGFLPYEDWLRNCGDVWVVIPRPSPTPVDPKDVKEVLDWCIRIPTDGSETAPTDCSPSDQSGGTGTARTEESPADQSGGTGTARTEESPAGRKAKDMWPHLVPIGDDGRLVGGEPGAIDQEFIKTLVYLFQEETSSHVMPRLAIFADGGYLPREYTDAILSKIRTLLMRKRIYPIFLAWDTEWWAPTRIGIEQLIAASVEASQRWEDLRPSPEVLEIIADSFAPRVWEEVKRRAGHAVGLPDGAARLLADAVSFKWHQQRSRGKPFQIHLIGHGAGDLLLAGLARALQAPVTSCTLWAPATTMRRFDATYRPMLDDGRLEHMRIFALDSAYEMDREIRSALHLISNILEFDWPWKAREAAFRTNSSPHRPEPLLGMHRYLVTDGTIGRLQRAGKLDIRLAQNPLHELLVADAADMGTLDYWQASNPLYARLVAGEPATSNSERSTPTDDSAARERRQRILVETIENITRFLSPPRPPRTEPRCLHTVDPLVRAQAAVAVGRAGPPGGLHG